MSLDTPILIVDGSTSMRTAIRQMLKEAGYKNMLVARDGAEGVHVLKESLKPSAHIIGLIICDLTLANISGMEMLQAVRKNSKMQAIPFIMLTNEKKVEQILEVVKKGANDVIIKPFTASLLIEKVKKLLPPSP
ncbi:MAG: response regulator [Desulfobulbaceae bacterium]|nr:response regulator [Desulfobulbaceae bacterium]